METVKSSTALEFRKNRSLRYVLFDLTPEWEEQASQLEERLAKEGITSIWIPRDGVWKNNIRPEEAEWKKHALVLTDHPGKCSEYVRRGIVSFGCSRRYLLPEEGANHPDSAGTGENGDEDGWDSACACDGSAWFEDAALVLEGFDETDGKYLEEWLLRAQGRPAEITETPRLLIREIAKEDIPALACISRRASGKMSSEREMTGMPADSGENCDFEDSENSEDTEDTEDAKMNISVNSFSEDRLHAYIRTAYRLQGFGLWSVLYQDKVIGCCGFEPWSSFRRPEGSEDSGDSEGPKEPEEPKKPDGTDTPVSADNHFALEMQYMLDPAYQRMGFGTEMCRASIRYAYERLGVDEIWLRIRRENQGSQALAKKLGFRAAKSGETVLYWKYCTKNEPKIL